MDATILIDARYVKTRQSGIGRHVLALLKRLPKLAPDLEWRAWTAAANASALPTDTNLRPVHNRFAPNAVSSLLPHDALFDFTDVSLFHSPHNTLGPRVPVPSVVTIHDLMWLTDPGYCDPRPLVGALRARYFRGGIARAMGTAEHILTVSKASADALVRYDKRLARKVTVTANAVESDFSPAADANASRRIVDDLVGAHVTYYLVVGQNQASKGHALAVRAFAQVPSNHKLVLVQRRQPGKGLARLVHEFGIEGRVRWLSEVSELELRCLLQNAHALLQPSFAEGFGMPALEAMACGCPVIASDIPPLVEVLAGAGLHARVGDMTSLAEAIARMNDHVLRDDLRARSIERAREYSWDDSAEVTVAVYRGVLRI
ncbi:MAG: glycosyltransferase family 4 protein [Myxococcales bacterium]|nr:glycosyltransferase family 4 protein [Myxococcales bacterium]